MILKCQHKLVKRFLEDLLEMRTRKIIMQFCFFFLVSVESNLHLYARSSLAFFLTKSHMQLLGHQQILLNENPIMNYFLETQTILLFCCR